TARTYSPRTRSAEACASFETSGRATTWQIPSRSRRSMKITPPRSRRVAAQPMRVTLWPTCSSRSAPQRCVRVRSPSGSATELPLEVAGHVARADLLLARAGHVADHPDVLRPLVLAADGHEPRPQLVRLLHLGLEAAALVVEEDAQPRAA